MVAQARDSLRDPRRGEQKLLERKRRQQGFGSSGHGGDRQLCPATAKANLERFTLAAHLLSTVCISHNLFHHNKAGL